MHIWKLHIATCEIAIPIAVRDIHETAFESCTNLMSVKFSNKIKEFVACDVMREWCNQGILARQKVIAYVFLLGSMRHSSAFCESYQDQQLAGHYSQYSEDHPHHIATTDGEENNGDDNINNEGINAHFVTIDAEITSDEAPMLFTDQLGSHKGIVLTILSFL